MRHAVQLVTGASLLLFLQTGCAELEPFLPKVTFSQFKVNEIDFKDADVDFVFAVENPNPISVSLSSFSYGMDFEQVSILEGDNEDGFSLESEGASDLVLPVNVVWEDAWNLVSATRGKDQIGFGLDGHMGFMLPELGEAKLPYKVEDEFPAVRTPKFKLKALRAPTVNLLQNRATLELDVGIDNDHGSTLFFDAFDYNIDIGGDTLAGGVVEALADVEGATEQDVTLPIEVNLLNAGAVLIGALTGGGNLDVGVGATMDVRTPFLEQAIPLTIDETGNLDIQLP